MANAVRGNRRLCEEEEDDDEDGLWTFLRNRGVPEENIQKMQRDKIDTSVAGEIDDATMAVYIPTYGDRIATRRFCTGKLRKNEDNSKRQSLLEKLRKKMKTASNREDSEEENCTSKHTRMHLRNNKGATKMTRKVELGWIHQGKQVRKRSGGGTRILDILKNDTKKEILSYAKQLFFPNGESRKGKWDEFSHNIYDFQEAELEETVSVGELYEALKLGVLRFYLFTKCLVDGDELSTKTDNEVEKLTEPMAAEQQTKPTGAVEQSAKPTGAAEQRNTATYFGVSSAFEVIDISSLSDTSEVIIGPLPSGPFASHLDDTLPIFQIEDEETIAIPSTSTPIPPFLDDAVHAAPPSPGYELEHVTVKLHRVNLLQEMVTQFKNPAMMSYPLKYSFIDEKGADADGVSRDVYAAFWAEFLDCAAEGADVRIPSLTPKWQEEEWKSIGRIMAKGFQDHGYFPSRLAPAFTAALTFGEHYVTSDLLFDSLMLYLSQSERDLLSTALQEKLVGDDEDELLDLMDRMGVTTVPTKDNLKAVLLQVAHKQLIQQPKYALDSIAEVAGPTFRRFFFTVADMQKMYDDLKPTTRKVLKLLDASPTTPAENQSLRFLQQYIRGLDEVGLRKIMRFVTGSDVLCVRRIEVIFTPLEGLARRLVAHTCGPVLELPYTYNCYPELRAEMESILASNSFTMDIV